MTWTQNYDPMGGLLLSTAIALIPIVYFFWALAIQKMKGHIAGLTTVILTVLIAIFGYGMPANMAVTSTVFGAFVGLWPIGWIVINAVFLYKLTVKSGQFDVIRSSISSLTNDRRLQVLLIAFSFNGFIEGAAGFGTPVAISAALLVGLGFRPLYAAGLCMIANTAPVAFGGIGIPLVTAAKTTGLQVMEIARIAGVQLGLMAIIVPFWVIVAMTGIRGAMEILPAILVSGLSFGLTMFLTATFLGPELPAIAASVVSLIALALFLKLWRPKHIFRFDDDPEVKAGTEHTYSMGQIVKAWSPFIVLTGFITLWALPAVKNILKLQNVVIPVPGLDKLIMQAAPIVTKPTPYGAVFTFDVLAAAGTGILLAALLSMFLVRLSFSDWISLYGKNLKELMYPLITISCVLGFAYIANYSGMSATLGLAAAKSGKVFPFMAPILGWLGVFLTGSDTSSCALFGNLQKITAEQIGVSSTLTVAANATGGVAGKMISPQSLAVAAGATGLVGQESDIFRYTLKHSIGMVLVISIMTYVMAFFM
ncbi:lactate permease LctP family transporter [Heliobacterium chlorum]|uniref:L-lactate permease n=1 Tax=Heliobacterium chlorum TaxID=2698 RepID=A0ABR7T2H0_HELCL|nr:lactate permease LctP family transporter [Heliobacterium chlorum]MBC9784968.1 lactate permease LctP family transporter [Heliobacterium chlorum]